MPLRDRDNSVKGNNSSRTVRTRKISLKKILGLNKK